MLQKEWLFFTLFILFVSSSFASDFAQKVGSLAKERYWQVLLHMKKGRSEIDDPSFFIIPKNKFSPKSELKATIQQLKERNQSMACRYPARIYWLRTKMPELFKEDNHTCEKLEKSLEKEDIHFVTLVFPTAYINSPASMFGHTFLRLDKNVKNPLIGEAVNYAARTNETNGLLYTYNGLLGGYKGYYSILPYYKKIKEYSAMEQRDMWEYTLSLSHEEIRKMLYHLYELQGIYGNYYFFTKNCSYNLLWLLESGKENTYLTQGFGVKAIPIDTIRAIKQANMIKYVHFRPSKRREMDRLVSKIRDIDLAKRFFDTNDTSLLSKCNSMQKVYITDLAILSLKHKRSQNKINKKTYVKNLMHLLKYRSKLPKTKLHKIAKPADPLTGHNSARLSMWISQQKDFSFIFKPAMHSFYDIETGYVPGAYIDFFKLSFEKSRFERFDFFSINSLSPRDRFFKPLSWGADISLQRVHEKKEIYCSFGSGVGYSWQKSHTLFFIMLKPKLYFSKNILGSVGFKTGMFQIFKDMKLGFIHRSDYFNDGIYESTTEFFITHKLNEVFALNLKLHEDKMDRKKEHIAEFGLFYYF